MKLFRYTYTHTASGEIAVSYINPAAVSSICIYLGEVRVYGIGEAAPIAVLSKDTGEELIKFMEALK